MKCPECQNSNIIIIRNETVCQDCGLVIEDNTIETPEVKEGAYTEQPYLATAGTNIDGKIVKSIWLLSTREKNLKHGLTQIDIIASKFHMPYTVINESKIIFKKSLYKELCISRGIQVVAYASVYIACSIHRIPKTSQELAINSETNNTKILRASKIIQKKLNMELTPTDPIDLLPRFASKLELKPETITKTTEILMKIKGTQITIGKKPETILSAAIYIASKKTSDKKTQRQLTNTIGIIELTIRKMTKKINLIIN